MLRPRRGVEKAENTKTVKSPFARYSVSAVGCLLICGVAFLFLMFGTDTIYQIDNNDINTATSISRTSVSTIVNTIENEENDQSGVINLPGLSGLSGIDYTAWYSDITGVTGNTSNAVSIGNVTAYKNIPWNSTENTFFFYSEKAKLELYDYLVSIGVPEKRGGDKSFVTNNYMAYMHTIDSIKPQPTGTLTDGTKVRTIDGIQCVFIAPMPAVANKDYFSSGDWGKASWTNEPDWFSAKFCIVVVPKGANKEDSSNYIYIPAVAGSAKAHTYPWGVAQTNVSVRNETSIAGFLYGKGDYGWTMSVGNASNESDIAAVGQAYDDGQGYGILHYLYCTLELCGAGKDFRDTLTASYDMVGYITFR